jgi:hypothetical protein
MGKPIAILLNIMGKPVWAHRPKKVNNYEWAHDRPMASAANTNKWAHYVNAYKWAHGRYC